MKKTILALSFFLTILTFTPPTFGIEVKLRLSGGFSLLSLQDLNRTLLDWEEWTKRDTAEHAGWSFIEGRVSKFRSGFDLDGELLLKIGPKIAFGIGAGSFIGELVEEKTALTIDRIENTYQDVRPVKITATPITFSGSYFFPLKKKWILYVKGGAGYVWGKYIDREGMRLASKENFSYSSFQRASGRGPIYIGGLGLEYEFEPQLRFFFEAGGRLAKISDFEGENDSGETGTLYFFEEYVQGHAVWQSKNRILTAEPSGQNYRSVQKTTVNLSGLALKIGLAITF